MSTSPSLSFLEESKHRFLPTLLEIYHSTVGVITAAAAAFVSHSGVTHNHGMSQHDFNCQRDCGHFSGRWVLIACYGNERKEHLQSHANGCHLQSNGHNPFLGPHKPSRTGCHCDSGTILAQERRMDLCTNRCVLHTSIHLWWQFFVCNDSFLSCNFSLVLNRLHQCQRGARLTEIVHWLR